jgi:hypothetical protein
MFSLNVLLVGVPPHFSSEWCSTVLLLSDYSSHQNHFLCRLSSANFAFMDRGWSTFIDEFSF